MLGVFKMDKIYNGVIGLAIRVNTNTDITLATGTTLQVKKPDGTEVVWTASIVDTDYLLHTTVLGDIDQSGKYIIQASLTLGGWTGEGESFEVFVFDKFE